MHWLSVSVVTYGLASLCGGVCCTDDHSRVVLDSDGSDSDYINANYITVRTSHVSVRTCTSHVEVHTSHLFTHPPQHWHRCTCTFTQSSSAIGRKLVFGLYLALGADNWSVLCLGDNLVQFVSSPDTELFRCMYIVVMYETSVWPKECKQIACCYESSLHSRRMSCCCRAIKKWRTIMLQLKVRSLM